MDDRPVILLVSEENADYLLDEFGRYARDYDLRTAHSAAESGRVVKSLPAGQPLALVVTESVLPDMDVNQALTLLQSWNVEESPEREEQRETWQYLKKALDEDRLSDHKLFP